MEILPITTPLLRAGDDLAAILMKSADVRPGDIIVVSSKAAAVCEGRTRNLADITPSADAKRISAKCLRSRSFCELMLEELTRLRGEIVGYAPGAALTELCPEGMRGSILVANAGLDESNVPANHAVGWPVDPVRSVRELRRRLLEDLGKRPMAPKRPTRPKIGSFSSVPSVPSVSSVSSIAVLLTDSICVPRRLGVFAITLAASGIDTHQSLIGGRDLYKKEMNITQEAIADQLATAANSVMGNAGQSTPAAIIRNHGIPFSDFEGWVPGIRKNEDLFRNL